MLPIIAFGGGMGAGKSTIAGEIAKLLAQHSCEARVGSFAGPLKRMCVEAFDLSEEAVYGPSEARGAKVSALVLADPWANTVAEKWCRQLFPADPAPARERWREVVAMLIAAPDELTVRKILQFFGTEWGRHLDRDLWARAEAAAAMQHFEQTCLPYMMADMRFQNENVATRRAGGLTIRVSSRRSPRPTDPKTHSSELWIYDAPSSAFSLDVCNDGPIKWVVDRVWDRLKNHLVAKEVL